MYLHRPPSSLSNAGRVKRRMAPIRQHFPWHTVVENAYYTLQSVSSCNPEDRHYASGCRLQPSSRLGGDQRGPADRRPTLPSSAYTRLVAGIWESQEARHTSSTRAFDFSLVSAASTYFSSAGNRWPPMTASNLSRLSSSSTSLNIGWSQPGSRGADPGGLRWILNIRRRQSPHWTSQSRRCNSLRLFSG